jgi:hypothetical protein
MAEADPVSDYVPDVINGNHVAASNFRMPDHPDAILPAPPLGAFLYE